MKILAFAASNSSKSINKQLVTYAANVLKANIIKEAQIEILDINDYEMPIYSSDREDAGGVPDLAHQFKAKITAADAVLISFAAHNGTYSAAYKNLFDWTSRIDEKVYKDTPMVLFSTSPGPGGAGSVLAEAKNAAPFFGADVKADLSVPNFYKNFDVESGTLRNADIEQQLQTALASLK